MADPTIYEPGYDFAATDKGANLNVELQRVAASVQSIASALADIRRSDGKLKNSIVTPDALNATALAGVSELGAGLEAELADVVARVGAQSVAATNSASAAQAAADGAVLAAEQATEAAVSATESAASAADTLAASRFAFSARKSADQTGIASDAATKIAFPVEFFDPGGYYDAANSRFTPPAGKYRLSAGAGWSAGIVDGRRVTVEIWKNGSVFRVFATRVSGTTDNALISGSCLVEANGTDYFEVYVTGSGAGDKTVIGSVSVTYFEGEAI